MPCNPSGTGSPYLPITVELVFKKNPGPGMCPLKGCRRCQGAKKKYCDRHHQRLWRFLHPLKAAFADLRNSARQRGKEFGLSLEYFAEIAVLNGYLEGKGNTRYALHVDRIDNSLGYIPGNIQIITCAENVIKENRRRFVTYFQQDRAPECPF